jgi:hypothetical protein
LNEFATSPAVDIRVVGAQRSVDDDSVVDGQTGVLGELGTGARTDADDHRVGRDVAAALGRHGRDSLGPAESCHARADPDVDAVPAVQLGEKSTHLRAERGIQRCRIRLDDGHIAAVLSCRGGPSSPIHPAPTTTTRPPP